MLFHLVGHLTQLGNILVLPQAQFNERGDFRTVVHLALFGKDHAPATFGLDTPHFRRGGWIAIPTTVAVRHLVEPVLGGKRADFHLFEYDVIPWIAHKSLPGIVRPTIAPPAQLKRRACKSIA